MRRGEEGQARNQLLAVDRPGFARLTVRWIVYVCISEAFGVLSDSAKRAAYDRGSEEYDDAQGRHHTSFWDEQNAAHSHNAHQRNNGPHAHFTRSNAFDIFNAFFSGHNPFGGNGHMQDPFASMGMGMGGGLFGSPFGMMGNMNGGGGHRGQHMRAQTDPFAGMFGGMGMMGMGGGFSMMSNGFGGGFGGGSSTSSSTSYDSAGRMITQTTRTTFENGQSKSVTTTQVRHPDGRIESSESHSLNGQPQPQQQAALPSARTPSPSMGRNIPISAGAHPRQAAPAAPRSPPIDLRSSSSSGSSSSDSDDEVQEIPAPIRRSPARAAPRPTYQHPAPAATTAAAPSIPADHFSHMRMHDMSQSQSQAQAQAAQTQTQTQTQTQAQAQRPPPHFSFAPSTHSPPMHQRSATHSFGSTGYSQEQMSAMRRDPYAQQQQQQQQQRDIDARLEQSRLATQRAQQELDAQRASLARMREEAAAAASRHLAHQQASSISQPFSSARSGSPSAATATAAGRSPIPPAAGTAAPVSSASGYAAPLPPHVRTSSGGHQYPSTVGKSPSPVSATRASPSAAAAAATDSRSNPTSTWRPPPPISSVPRGVSGDMLNRRGDRTFDECFSEHATDQRRRTKL